MGPAGLTAVFGMGTGVAPQVWSPEIRPAGRQTSPAAVSRGLVTAHCTRARGTIQYTNTYTIVRFGEDQWATGDRAGPCLGGAGGRSGWSSCLAVRTGRLRRSLVVHARPIDLVVFQEPSWNESNGNLVSEGASRLDAFSAYPVPTWLPGDALSRTAGTPEVGPPQSSRTRGDSPQVSYAHGR